MTDLRRALAINAAILQVVTAAGRVSDIEFVTVHTDPPWSGTIAEALDMADAALENNLPATDLVTDQQESQQLSRDMTAQKSTLNCTDK
jgi:hypothetical protein